jgi:hypothetical protein
MSTVPVGIDAEREAIRRTPLAVGDWVRIDAARAGVAEASLDAGHTDPGANPHAVEHRVFGSHTEQDRRDRGMRDTRDTLCGPRARYGEMHADRELVDHTIRGVDRDAGAPSIGFSEPRVAVAAITVVARSGAERNNDATLGTRGRCAGDQTDDDDG